jgi:hypothetical protein
MRKNLMSGNIMRENIMRGNIRRHNIGGEIAKRGKIRKEQQQEKSEQQEKLKYEEYEEAMEINLLKSQLDQFIHIHLLKIKQIRRCLLIHPSLSIRRRKFIRQ